MTTKAKATKASKTPAINPAAIGRHIGESLGQLQSGLDIAAKATEAINADVKTLRDAKVKIGETVIRGFHGIETLAKFLRRIQRRRSLADTDKDIAAARLGPRLGLAARLGFCIA